MSVAIEWTRVHYVMSDGRLCSHGETWTDTEDDDTLSRQRQHHWLQSISVDGLSCGWNKVYLLSRGSCYVSSDMSAWQCLHVPSEVSSEVSSDDSCGPASQQSVSVQQNDSSAVRHQIHDRRLQALSVSYTIFTFYFHDILLTKTDNYY